MPRPRATQQREPKPDARATLIDVGTRLFSTHGYDQASIDDIASSAGIAKGLLYYYFANKRALYVEVVRVAAEHLRQATTPDPSVPPRLRTAAVLTGLITWAKQYGDPLRILLAQGSGGDAELQTIMRDARQRQVDMMLAGMREVREELGLPPLASEPTVRYAIRGWIAFIEVSLADWLERRDLTDDQLRALFLHAAGGLLSAAHRTEQPSDL